MNTNFNFIYPDINPFATGGSLTTNIGKLGTTGSLWAALAVSSINAAGITTSGTSTFNGPVTFGSTSTFNGPVTFGSTTTFNGVMTVNTSPSFATNVFLTPNTSGTRYLLIDDGASNTGSYTLQAGGGSAGYGGAFHMFGHSHASRPGQVVAAISANSNGRFTVNNSGLAGGTDLFVVTAAGLVSIGHTNPSQTIDINGTVAFTTGFITGSGSTINMNTSTVASITVTNFYHAVTNSGMSSGSQGALEFIVAGTPGQMLMLEIRPTGDSLDLVGDSGTITSNLDIGTTTIAIGPLNEATASFRYNGRTTLWHLFSFARL